MKPTHLSLFSGIGGLDIAAEWAGFQTVGQCEWADYPHTILENHWPDIPKWRDIKTLTGGDFYEQTGLRTVDVISGGFPCQPFSVAGKRRGAEDDRYLWPEMLRVIEELQPTWVVGENVAGIVNMALDDVLSDLEAKGYETRAFIIPACGVDAPHRRDRVAIVAHCQSKGIGGLSVQQGRQESSCSDIIGSGENVAYAEGERRNDGDDCQNQRKANRKIDTFANAGVYCRKDVPDSHRFKRERSGTFGKEAGIPKFADGSWWAVEPRVGRVAHGIPHRVDRLKCLGNAVVPYQFYPVFRGIYEIITGRSAKY